MAALNGSLTSAASGATFTASPGPFSFSLSGTWVGTVVLEIDSGGAFVAYNLPDTSTAVSTTANGFWTLDLPHAALLRVRCSAFTSGTIAWRLEQ